MENKVKEQDDFLESIMSAIDFENFNDPEGNNSNGSEKYNSEGETILSCEKNIQNALYKEILPDGNAASV
jgi:hypothetical protein